MFQDAALDSVSKRGLNLMHTFISFYVFYVFILKNI